MNFKQYKINMKVMLALIVGAGLFSISDSHSADIGDYEADGNLINLTRDDGRGVSQQSTLFLFDGNQISMANGGGMMLYRSDMADPSTNVRRELGNMGGCGDIEGGYQFGDKVLLANESTPATIHVMQHPSILGGCNNDLETFTLSGMDETSGSWGIEGIAILNDGRFVVVKQNQPARIAVFDYVEGTANYNPTDLFDLESKNCGNVGDLTVRPETGNVLIICKAQGAVKEFTISGDYISEMAIPQFGQAEGIMEYPDGRVCINGEAAQYQCFLPSGVVIPPPPPILSNCTISGDGVLDTSTGLVTGTLTANCENSSGTVELESQLTE